MKYALRLLVAGASMLGFIGATAPAAHADCVLVTAQVLWNDGSTTGPDQWCAWPTGWWRRVHIGNGVGPRDTPWALPGYNIDIWIPLP